MKRSIGLSARTAVKKNVKNIEFPVRRVCARCAARQAREKFPTPMTGTIGKATARSIGCSAKIAVRNENGRSIAFLA